MLGMLGDKKKAVADIVLMLGHKKNVGRDSMGNTTREVSNEEPESDNKEQMSIIAEDMINAIQNKSIDKLASALSAFASCCNGMESGSSEEE